MKNNRYFQLFKNTNGFSILEIMITASVMMVVIMGMISFTNSQQKQSKSLSQKQELIDLKNTMLLQLLKTPVCSFHLKDKEIDATVIPTDAAPSPTTIAFNQLYQSPDPGAPVIAKVGEKLPGTQSNLKVQSITFKNIYATGNPDEYKGVFEIAMQAGSLALSLKPIQLSTILKTDPTSPDSAKKILECVASANEAVANLGACDPGAYLTGYDADSAPMCKELPNCDAGKILQGFDSLGDAICVRLKYADIEFTQLPCPASQYQTGIGPSGEPLCATLPPVLPPPSADCTSPNGNDGETRIGPACPIGQTGTITYKCVKPSWQTISTCVALPPCKKTFYDPQIFCSGSNRYVKQGKAVEFCQLKGFDTGVKTVEHRTGSAVCTVSGGVWVKYDSGSNGTLGVVVCTKYANCAP